MIPEEWTTYFCALVENDPEAERWETWWERNQGDVERILSRGSYLRISSTPLMEIYSILGDAGHSYELPKTYRHPKFHVPSPIPREWLTVQIDVDTVDNELEGSMLNDSDWAPIRDSLRETDTCWRFSSPDSTWQEMMGRSGYAFVRDGEPYDAIVTAMN